MDFTPAVINIERTVDNEWFTVHFVRNDGIRLFGHIQYKVWSGTAKKKTKELMDSLEEPLHVFAHDQKHLKFLLGLGFTPTGNFVKSSFPGKEHDAFGELVYYKDGVDKYAIKVYEEYGHLVLPLSSIDGYGKIEEIEKVLLEKEQVAWTTRHYFSDGVYTRETFVPAGTVLTGYRHKHETVSILTKGAISVMAVDKLGHAVDFGVMVAPQIVVTKPYMKKIGLAHEDTVFVNSFNITEIPTRYRNEDHIGLIEEYIFEKDEPCLE